MVCHSGCRDGYCYIGTVLDTLRISFYLLGCKNDYGYNNTVLDALVSRLPLTPKFSVSPILSKVLKHLLVKKITRILPLHQFRFRKRFSVCDALLDLAYNLHEK